MPNPTPPPDWEGFARAVMENWFDYADLDGSDRFDLGRQFNLLREIPGGYDPEEHVDELGNLEPGEAYFMLNDPGNYQRRVMHWLLACFGAEIIRNPDERNHRFLEEALELVQSTGCTQAEAHQLVDYVFNRPVGDPPQEVGGVMVTLAGLCEVQAIDLHKAAEDELASAWTRIDKIRAKQKTKPKHSPLPGETPC